MSKRKGNTIAYTGTFVSTGRGFGFLTTEDEREDLYIPAGKTGGAFHGDRVEAELIRPKSGDHHAEGKIVKILDHTVTEIVGTYEKLEGFGFVVPDNRKIPFDVFVAKEDSMGAVTGHKVVVHITDYGNGRHQKPEGEVTEILGHENDPGVDLLSIVKAYDLPVDFPEKVLHQADRVACPVSETDLAAREDLRETPMVTIDGEDSKDLDDAVSLSFRNGIYRLGVHIADVSHYVKESSALDEEALRRGTSVYLADRVIPMLPHVLCNGICSLNMGEDRLALSCIMDLDEKGQMVDHRIVESVIRVNERMNYTDVNEIFEAEDKGLHNSLLNRYEAMVPMFNLMRKLSEILHENRRKRGSVDFDIPESKITVDEEGKVLKIAPYDRGISQRIIEEFMLLANETVAEHFYWMDSPFVYRVHGVPDPEKIMKLGTFINNFGYSIRVRNAKGEVHPREIQKLLSRIEGTDEEALITRLTLRSMQRAEYHTECSGHFGLAAEYYCHFTSPIRRYPDLCIHRIIKDHLSGRMNERLSAHYDAVLPMIAKQSSELERRADETQREADKLKKCQYMAERIGKSYEGVISGITEWGIYVELPNTVEGMIHVSKLPGDYYYYKEETYEMVGMDKGRTYKLGQKLKIRVEDVDIKLRTIDFLEDEDV